MSGAIAQLGERLNGIQEVSGSIPLGSTILLLPTFPDHAAPLRSRVSASTAAANPSSVCLTSASVCAVEM